MAACSPHSVTTRPAPPVKLPVAFSSGGSQAPAPNKWWLTFSDSQLNALVDQAMAGNLQLKAAWARLSQAAATVRAAGATRFPTLTGSLTGFYQRSASAFSGEVGTQSNFELSAAVNYELDLFRRLGSQADAAKLNAIASRDDVEAMAMTLASQITETWFTILFEQAQRKLLTEQVKTNKTFLELVEFRFKQGLVTALDVFQQRQQLVATEAQLTTVVSRLAQARNALAVLVGKPPGAITVNAGDELPKVGPLPGTGIPADLLIRRPDVRAMRRRLVAADYQVAAAVAARLPGLSISPKGGLRGDSFNSGMFNNSIAAPFYSIAAGLTGVLFDWGRLSAEVDRNKAVVQEALAGFGQQLLVALQEVENALVLERQQHELIKKIEEQLELADKSLEQARARYQAGLVDFLRVLTALQNKQRLEVQLLGARRQLLSYRVQLCRALGGTWTRKLKAPNPAELKQADDKRDTK